MTEIRTLQARLTTRIFKLEQALEEMADTLALLKEIEDYLEKIAKEKLTSN